MNDRPHHQEGGAVSKSRIGVWQLGVEPVWPSVKKGGDRTIKLLPIERSMKRLQIGCLDSALFCSSPFEWLDGNRCDHWPVREQLQNEGKSGHMVLRWIALGKSWGRRL